MEYENRLIPVLREGVDVIKMIFYKKLKIQLCKKYPHRSVDYINRLAGAIINALFGTPNQAEPFATFVADNKFFIKLELKNIAKDLPEMRLPLTDALRVQFLCDHQEGIDSSQILTLANQLGILALEREAPLPAKFMALVRKLGGSLDLLTST